ncbi:MAG TPA: hypothetical protein VEP66_16360 [Myxococcales bacterium]|nr:hypothetical protein [Myxococcales bacterium]
MNTRWTILLAALLGTSCLSNSKSSLAITKVVLGTATTNAGPPPVTTCAYDPGSNEFSYAQIDPAANTGGTMGVVVENNLLDTSTLNPELRTNSATFHPHQAVADYEVIGGSTVTEQLIPVSGSIQSGSVGIVLVPFFSPIPATMLSGVIRISFWIEGVLDDGSNIRTSTREYIFVTCATAGCNSACL